MLIMFMQFSLTVSQQYGDCYLTNIMLPVFMVSVGDNADLNFFPTAAQLKIKGLSHSFRICLRTYLCICLCYL